jgi:hypothetical protein
VEVLHESERTVVTRVALPGGDTVIRKQVRGPDCEQRVRRERAMLQRLAGWSTHRGWLATPRPATRFCW